MKELTRLFLRTAAVPLLALVLFGVGGEFHQYNERHDDIQALFMRLMGVDAPDVPANLDDAHAYIRAMASPQMFPSLHSNSFIKMI
jgi:hypothetical protein